MDRIVGIDLGTTYSCVAIVDESGKPKVIPHKGGTTIIPSVVAIDEKGNTLVGVDAKRQSLTNPHNTIYASKRLIGRHYKSETIARVKEQFTYDMAEGRKSEVMVRMGNRFYALSEIAALILDEVREAAQNYLQEKVARAVVTVPAYFNDRQRQAVREAGRLIGLEIVRIINEPTAAALAYGYGRHFNKKVLIYDLGGGTFDVTIMAIRDKIFEVMATGGDTFLGGVDFDNRIMNYVLDKFEEEHGVDLMTDMMALQRVRDAAENAKIELSQRQETRINIPYVTAGPKGPLNIDLTLTRAMFHKLVDDLIDLTTTHCMGVLADAKIAMKDLDDVILVGGMTRVPRVDEKLQAFFNKPLRKNVHPDEAVAIGASLMAHSLGTSRPGEGVTLLDVLPIAIGIGAAGGKFVRIFERNSSVPNMKSRTLTTGKDNQTSLNINIYQGDNDLVAENELLGNFTFSGIRQARKGEPKIEVIFHIDHEGILHVSARDQDTGAEHEATIQVSSTSTPVGSLLAGRNRSAT